MTVEELYVLCKSKGHEKKELEVFVNMQLKRDEANAEIRVKTKVDKEDIHFWHDFDKLPAEENKVVILI